MRFMCASYYKTKSHTGAVEFDGTLKENEHLRIEIEEFCCLLDLFILSHLLSWKNSRE